MNSDSKFFLVYNSQKKDYDKVYFMESPRNRQIDEDAFRKNKLADRKGLGFMEF